MVNNAEPLLDVLIDRWPSRLLLDGNGRCLCTPCGDRTSVRHPTSWTDWLRLVCRQDRRQALDFWNEVQRLGSSKTRLWVERPNDQRRCFRVSMNRLHDGSGSARYGVELVEVSEEAAEIDQLKEKNTELRHVIEYNPQLPWIADAEGNIVEFTERWLDGSGLTEDDAKGAGWLEATHPGDIKRVHAEIARAQESGSNFDVRVRLRINDEYRWMRAQSFPQFSDQGDIVRWYGYTEDIHESVLVEETIRWNATHDSLTDLPNRAYFGTELEGALGGALANLQKVGLLIIDIDNFKDVNDLMGHQAGDLLLQKFTAKLETLSSDDVFIARPGGDEFAIICKDIKSRDALLDWAQQILDMRETLSAGGRSVECRFSIGAALFPEDGATADNLLRNADLALYRAKSLGKARVCAFDPSLLGDMQERLGMVNRARTAVRERSIMPFYQPKVALNTGQISGFEALLRWRDNTGRIRSPGEINAAFEDPDVAHLLGQSMIELVLQDVADWTRRGLQFGHVALNVSSKELQQENFVPELMNSMKRYSVDASSLEIEITEGVFLGAGSEAAQRSIMQLHEHGLRLALDDFGTGFASLTHLRSIPIKTLKIDMSFVSGMLEKPSDRAIVSALTQLGRELDLEVVAEGVENERQLSMLRNINCPCAQGYYFSEPINAVQAAKFVERWSQNLFDKQIAVGG